ncbi:MAG: hypothetical protein RI995_747 [Bacteroidota bacterium]|jgi:hypothetical protein
MKKLLLSLICAFVIFAAQAQHFFSDVEKSYSAPSWSQTAKGELLLSWVEKDKAGMNSLCMAISKDKGISFSDKKTIASGYGVGSSRLMKAEIFGKKDGSFVAVFINNPAAQPGKPSRGGQVSYAVSKDNGTTWSAPAAVDQDPTPGLMRGFFGAALMANDEVAVVYLKDVKGSTKFEERDLRIAITKNGQFQAEKLIDPVVCDCCNIGLMVDSKGVLNVYYRDNNNDIRDFSHIYSKDNGLTFSSPRNIYKDNWQINGCPHNGAYPIEFNKQNYVAWFSGAETDRGVKLVTEEGKKITTPNEGSAKNFGLAKDAQKLVFFWEQLNAQTNQTQLAYQIMSGGKVSTNKVMNTPAGAANASLSIQGDKALVAYELKDGARSVVKVEQVLL